MLEFIVCATLMSTLDTKVCWETQDCKAEIHRWLINAQAWEKRSKIKARARIICGARKDMT